MRKLFITAALMVSLTASAHQPQYERQDSIHVVQILQDASKLRAGTNLILYIARLNDRAIFLCCFNDCNCIALYWRT